MRKLCVSAAILALTATAFSVQAKELELSANVGFATDYAFRGISQSDENFAIQGGFDAVHESGLYAGIWASTVDFNDRDEASMEADIYAGYGLSINNVSYDLGLIYYAYPGADSNLDYDFWEAVASIGYDFDRLSASASIFYSPDYFGGSGDAFYYALDAETPLPNDFSLSGHLGYQTIDDEAQFGIGDDSYLDWSIGLNYAYEGFDLSLQYVDTNLDEPGECADGCSERIIFSVSRQF